MTKEHLPPLEVDSFAELCQQEAAIIERIEKTPNGGYLFQLHPLMLLRDLGVRLSKKAVRELVEQEPTLASLNPAPYLALRASDSEQPIRVRVRHLFKGENQ